MKRSFDRSTRLILVAAALLGLTLVPAHASAQSELDSSEAEAFMGEWEIAMDTQMGPFTLDLVVEDQDGKVAANMGSPDMGGSQEITDITREGENLVLAYQMDAQGQVVPVVATLTPAGADLEATIDFADGMFVAVGEATRTDG